MPQIKLAKTGQIISVEKGANLMESLLAHHIPVASSCHGDAVCGKCRVEVKEGNEHLKAPGPAEQIVSRRLRINPPYRVSCQVKVDGDITVDTAYW